MSGAAREVALVSAGDAALGARLRAATWRGAIPTVVVAPDDRRAERLAIAAGAEIGSVWPDLSRPVVLVDRPLAASDAARLAGRTVIAPGGVALDLRPMRGVVRLVDAAADPLPGAGIAHRRLGRRDPRRAPGAGVAPASRPARIRRHRPSGSTGCGSCT